MYKMEFKLKQHTPLIHFQHIQSGATIRASEIKPKLDKYLLAMIFDNDFQKVKEFLTGFKSIKEKEFKTKFENGFNALDYSMVVSTNETAIESTVIDDRFPCYFGDMGEDNEADRKQFRFTKEPVILTFKTNHHKLAEVFSTEIPNFFARHNFGTRQSKGFGSFYIHENDDRFEQPGLYSYFISIAKPTEYKRIFEDIEMVYKAIRSGINDKGRGGVPLFYMKALIWQYFRLKNIGWEKRKIKKEFYPVVLQKQTDEYNIDIEEKNRNNWPLQYESNQYRIVKDLLGLSSLEKWKIPYSNEIKKESPDIDRMKSPLFFKPIQIGNEFRIYIDFELTNPEFLNKEFSISNQRKEFKLNTPVEFDIEHFMNWCLNEASIKTLIAETYLETPKAKRLLKIFGQLRTNILN